MMRAALIALLIGLTTFPVSAGAALAQRRVTSDMIRELQNKVEMQRDAYYRFDTAEKDALADGMNERADAFHKAKQKAYETYVSLSAELKKAEGDKDAYDRKMSEQTRPER